jgi:pimeloyl-ACP methyl ester carboxylesterase
MLDGLVRLPGLSTLVVGVGFALFLAAAAKAFRTYQWEASQFVGRNHPVPRPSDASSVGLSDVAMRVPGGFVVRGWYLPSANGSAIVYAHGSPADRRQLLPEARALARRGYGALLVDMPGHGESEGPATWGEASRAAIRAAVDELASRAEVRRIGAYGFSMSSSVVATVAAADPRIRAIVLAGAFTTIEAQLEHEFSQLGPLTRLPALAAARRGGLAMDELRTVDVISRLSPRPLLVISGTEDGPVPTQMTRALVAAAGEPKEFWVIQGAGHGDYGDVLGDAYFERLARFFDLSLRG